MATVAEALEKSLDFSPSSPFNKGIDLDRARRSPRLFLFRAGATIRSKRKGWLSVGLCAAKGYALDAVPVVEGDAPQKSTQGG